MSFLLVLKSVTLNDLEQRNGRYIALFQRINLVNVVSVCSNSTHNRFL